MKRGFLLLTSIICSGFFIFKLFNKKKDFVDVK